MSTSDPGRGRAAGLGAASRRASWPGLDRTRAGGAGAHGRRDPASAPVPYLRECDPLTGELIRSSKATGVRYEHDHPGSLGHMDVKKLGKIPTGEDGGPEAEPPPAPNAIGDNVMAGRGSTTFTPWSMTTPGWPTPRFCPTRRAPPARDSWNVPSTTSPSTADVSRHAGYARFARSATLTRSSRSSSDPTAPGRTARSNDSTAPSRSNGPTDRSSSPTPNASKHWRPGWSTTTLIDATQPSEASHRSAD